MDWWNNALQAAEKGLTRAKEIGKKGLEVVEATAEEANRKLQLNLHDKVGAGGKAAPPSPAELEAFGLTQEFADWVRTLNYSAFREFPADHLLSLSGAAGGEAAGSSGSAGEYKLNPWQVRHATLVVQALKEVNELRFVLCPKYMTDEHFWHVYFTLARKHLPDAAYSWGPEDLLPTFEEEAAGEAFSLTSLSSQLKQLGSKLQSASASGRQRAGLELSNLVSSVRGERGSPGPEAAAAASSSPGAEAGGGAAGGAAGAAAAGAAGAASAAAAAAGEAKAAPPAGMLEEDPDLEAYLQVAISGSAPGSTGGDEFGGEDDDDDDLDLDSYINELSAEVEAAAAAQADGGAAAAADEAQGEQAGEEQPAAADGDAAGSAAEAPEAAAADAGKESKKD